VKVTVTFSDIDGTLVHYPTGDAAAPGEPYADGFGSITQESVHPGFQLYTDKVSCRKQSTFRQSNDSAGAVIGVAAAWLGANEVCLLQPPCHSC